jgi:hypothetical protein
VTVLKESCICEPAFVIEAIELVRDFFFGKFKIKTETADVWIANIPEFLSITIGVSDQAAIGIIHICGLDLVQALKRRFEAYVVANAKVFAPWGA